MPKLNRNGVKINYEVYGNGPALLFTHGFSATSKMWNDQIDSFSKHYQLIIWDMRGHGHTDYPDDLSLYSEEETIEDIRAILNELQINKANIRWLFKRELLVSIINGIVLSVVIGGITFFWFQEVMISVLICVAMTINLISSVVAGMVVPIILRRLNQDPAIAGSVVVTTVTDVVGFFSFLGLATIFLIN